MTRQGLRSQWPPKNVRCLGPQPQLASVPSALDIPCWILDIIFSRIAHFDRLSPVSVRTKTAKLETRGAAEN